MATVVLDTTGGGSGLGQKLARRFALARFFREELLPAPDYSSVFAARFGPALELFAAILERIDRQCAQAGTRLTVLVLAGRSFVEQPKSLSAQYQEYFAGNVMRVCRERGIVAADLAGALREDYRESKARYFHPNDGHLTAAGHEAVARIILERRRRGERQRVGTVMGGF
ncbi:MAG: alginate O-acetyltransferase AlgX-related protein [Limisphaerales bacterium]